MICMLAYVGPGGLLSALAALLALVAAGTFSLAGCIWYPIQRLLAALRRRGRDRGEP